MQSFKNQTYFNVLQFLKPILRYYSWNHNSGYWRIVEAQSDWRDDFESWSKYMLLICTLHIHHPQPSSKINAIHQLLGLETFFKKFIPRIQPYRTHLHYSSITSSPLVWWWIFKNYTVRGKNRAFKTKEMVVNWPTYYGAMKFSANVRMWQALRIKQ